jgi:hypothetical protein
MTDRDFVRSPDIAVDELPQQEHDLADLVSDQLADITRHIRTFANALALKDWSDISLEMYNAEGRAIKENDRTKYREWRDATRDHWTNLLAWRQIAFRDAAMTVFHFGKNYKATKKMIADKAPVLASKLDNKRLEESGRLFNNHFPDFEKVRNSFAHYFAPENRPRNATNDGIEREGLSIAAGTQTTLHSVTDKDTMINSYLGSSTTFTFNAEALNNLRAVRDEFFAAFDPVNRRLLLISKLAANRPENTIRN